MKYVPVTVQKEGNKIKEQKFFTPDNYRVEPAWNSLKNRIAVNFHFSEIKTDAG